MTAAWSPAVDAESGVTELWWALGSAPYHADLAKFKVVEAIEGRGARRTDLAGVKAGQLVFVTVKARNGAGLLSVWSSVGFRLDTTPPRPGHVRELASAVATDSSSVGAKEAPDVDYQKSRDTLHVTWQGFSEPQGGDINYEWCLGTKHGSGACDIRAFEAVGTHTSASIVGAAALLPMGVRVYTTVRATNAAGLSVLAWSDGVTADDTPPVTGRVFDGIGGREIAYQGVDSVVLASWAGFFDAESGLAYYEWCASAPGSSKCEYVPWTNVALETDGRFVIKSPLPQGKRITVRVRATNGAGLRTEAVSNGFVIDLTPPQVKNAVIVTAASRSVKETLNDGKTRTVSMPPNTQRDPSHVRVRWTASDDESGLQVSTWSLQADDGQDTDVYHSDAGGLSSHAVAGLRLSDGDRVRMLVTVCNNARLCATATSVKALIDYTPPLSGRLAERIGVRFETGVNPELALKWSGFSDPESDVISYEIRVAQGAFYGNGNTLRLERTVSHSGAADAEQSLTSRVMLLRRLNDLEVLFVSVTPLNGVGTRGTPAYAEFRLARGSEMVQRLAQCSVQDCSGLCSCGPHYHCPTRPGCTAITTGQTAQRDLQAISQPAATASTHILSGTWVEKKLPAQSLRYELSASVDGSAPGSGLYDLAHDNYWFNAGATKRGAVGFSLPMVSGQKYQLHVRSYGSKDDFKVFSAPAVLVDTSAPAISNSHRVLDLAKADGSEDVDFVGGMETDKLHAAWDKVFQEAQTSIESFKVAAGTHPGASDIASWRTISKGTTTRYTFSGLGNKLRPGVPYYVTVHAFNSVGLSSFAFSDGITLDLTPPTAGVVRHGGHSGHQAFHQGTAAAPKSGIGAITVSASWNAFFDPESGIEGYEWAIGTTASLQNVLKWRSVGLALEASADIPSEKFKGVSRFYVLVRATNGNGDKTASSSPSVTVDATPPRGLTCALNIKENAVKDADFETSAGDAKGSPWRFIKEEGKFVGARGSAATAAAPAFSGGRFLHLDYTVSQTLTGLKASTTYVVSFHAVSYGARAGHQVLVTDPSGRSTSFYVPARPAHSMWQRYSLVFVAPASAAAMEALTFAPDAPGGIGIDVVSVRACASSHAAANVFAVDRHFVSSTASLRVSWTVEDAQSGISSYSWALGTTIGGEQAVPYTDVGSDQTGEARELALTHGAKLYASLVARNRAGGVSVFRSTNPLVVDLTPPVLDGVIDTMGKIGEQVDEDIDTVRANTLLNAVVHGVSDPESGIERCVHALGRAPYSADLVPWKPMAPLGSTGKAKKTWMGSALVPPKTTVGTRVFATVICTNHAGLVSRAVSSGAIVYASLTTSDFALAINTRRPSPSGSATAPPPSSPSSPIPQAADNELALSWEASALGVDSFRVRLINQGASQAMFLRNVAHAHALHATGLKLPTGKTVRAIVDAVYLDGTKSVAAEKTLVVRSPPSVISNKRVTIQRVASGYRIDWKGLFSGSDSTLAFCSSLGLFPHTTGLRAAEETTGTSLMWNVPFDVARFPVYLTVSATNDAAQTVYHTAMLSKP